MEKVLVENTSPFNESCAAVGTNPDQLVPQNGYRTPSGKQKKRLLCSKERQTPVLLVVSFICYKKKKTLQIQRRVLIVKVKLHNRWHKPLKFIGNRQQLLDPEIKRVI